jgi:hypothetical protein
MTVEIRKRWPGTGPFFGELARFPRTTPDRKHGPVPFLSRGLVHFSANQPDSCERPLTENMDLSPSSPL